MRSPRLWLLDKEARELAVCRAWWLLLLVIGPLTGVSFISAIRTYAEVSAGGAGETLSPLTGVWAPTFSACELAAVFLLPFVVIRIVAGDRQSGALKLELQQSAASPVLRIAAKAAVLLLGWMVAMLPALSAIVLWKLHGGSTFAPELAALIGGHVLNGLLTIGLAAAAAALTEHPATAAIVALSITVGTWIVSFFAAIQGGLWELLAAFTPSAVVSDFQHGLVRLDSLLAAFLIAATGLGLAAIWQRMGTPVLKRVYASCALILAALLSIALCSFAPATWDVSEDRNNSFSLADERALRNIHDALKIVVHLAPEDPRRTDIDRRALSKLRRVMQHVDIQYVSSTSSGLFEQSNEGYGEIWYSLRGSTRMSRATTAESVLENIYELANVSPQASPDDPVFRGHPLKSSPPGAAAIFYFVWPGVFVLSALLLRRRFR